MLPELLYTPKGVKVKELRRERSQGSGRREEKDKEASGEVLAYKASKERREGRGAIRTIKSKERKEGLVKALARGPVLCQAEI